MAMYGHSFTLGDPSKTDLMDPATGPGTAGQYTKGGGILSYYEVKLHILSIYLNYIICAYYISYDVLKFSRPTGWGVCEFGVGWWFI